LIQEKIYDYIIIGAGVNGCCIAHELSSITNSILLIDEHNDVAQGASKAAGAFLSPLLGKPNQFKDLITTALKYSSKFYKEKTPLHIDQCGTVRIPKDIKDREKFISYLDYMDFDFIEKDDGYLFDIASVVDGYNTCKELTKDIKTLFNCNIHQIKKIDDIWHLNSKYKAKNIIITTGANTKFIEEEYINIRAVWGQRIDISTTTVIDINYHKECSVSRSIKIDNNLQKVSIGATHHRLADRKEILKNNANNIFMSKEACTQCLNTCISIDDTKNLLKKANDIINLENINIIDSFAGARACSSDYFPMIGKLVNSKLTLKEFPYLKNGTNVQESRYTYIDNLYIMNGVGGRGYVLAPYLAKQLFNYIINDDEIYDIITPNRLFKRWVKRKQ
jgi:glycine/D-amino acid oxidase-like deaminating enzyme